MSTPKNPRMDVFVVFGQRIESYEGQFAPEALSVIDEFGNEENPDYILGELTKAKESGEFESVAVVRIAVDQGAIMEILRPQAKVLRGDVSAVDA